MPDPQQMTEEEALAAMTALAESADPAPSDTPEDAPQTTDPLPVDPEEV